MKLSPQKELIVSKLRDLEWHCQTEWLGLIKDDRKRISELNQTYMREKGYEIIGQRCDGRCGKKHSSTLFMRKAVPLRAPAKYQVSAEDLAHAQSLIKAFEEA